MSLQRGRQRAAELLAVGHHLWHGRTCYQGLAWNATSCECAGLRGSCQAGRGGHHRLFALRPHQVVRPYQAVKFPLLLGFSCLRVDTALGVTAQGLLSDCAGIAVAPVAAADRDSDELAERRSHADVAPANPAAAAQRAGAGSAVPGAGAASGACALDNAQPSDARGGQQPEASTSGRGAGAGFGAAARSEREVLASGGSVRAAAQKDQREVADKLIGVFQERDGDGWRRLIASSRLWTTLADGCASGPTVRLRHNTLHGSRASAMVTYL